MANTASKGSEGSETFTHTVSLNGHTAGCTIDTFDAVCSAMIAAHGPGVPRVTLGAPGSTAVQAPAPAASRPVLAVVPPVTPAPAPVTFEDRRTLTGSEAVDATAKTRVTADQASAERVGFALPRRFFEDGTVLYGSGVDAMSRERAEHDKLPLAPHAFEAVRDVVQAERRKDATVDVRAIRLDSFGRIELPHPTRPGVYVPLRAADHATQALLARTGIPLYTALQGAVETGSRDVVSAVATTFATWQAHAAGRDVATHADAQRGKRGRARKAYEPRNVVIGVRDGQDGEREIFRVVSERYTDLPIDKIAEALRLACPADARARLDYDGKRLTADVEFFTDVKPENAVVGETWKAVARITTDDTGGGSIRGDGGIFMALCRNFTYTSAWQSVFALRHMGDLDRMVASFREGFAATLATIAPFVKAWSKASSEDVIASVRADLPEVRTIPVSEMMAGIFAHQIGQGRDLVPVPGKKAERVAQLVRAAQGDTSAAGLRQAGTLTRAGVVNAFTRLAHTGDVGSAAQIEIERAASQLMTAPAGRSLPRFGWVDPSTI